jgi:hypothetical protein
MEFAKIALGQLTDIMNRFKVKFSETTIATVIQTCRGHFQRKIFPSFVNDGKKWMIEVDIPQGFPGAEQGRLEFSNEIVLECFQPSMRSIRKMMIASILNLHDTSSPPSVFPSVLDKLLIVHIADKSSIACFVRGSVRLVEVSIQGTTYSYR